MSPNVRIALEPSVPLLHQQKADVARGSQHVQRVVVDDHAIVLAEHVEALLKKLLSDSIAWRWKALAQNLL